MDEAEKHLQDRDEHDSADGDLRRVAGRCEVAVGGRCFVSRES